MTSEMRILAREFVRHIPEAAEDFRLPPTRPRRTGPTAAERLLSLVRRLAPHTGAGGLRAG
ncbi:MAG TPA: hypothetical protein VIO94_08845 [Phenylobacterium sp.]